MVLTADSASDMLFTHNRKAAEHHACCAGCISFMLTHAGDAGAIGRVVCTSAGPSADGHAVARVSSRPPDKPGQARKGRAAAAAVADGSDSDAAASSESLDEEEDGESDSQSDQEGSEAALGSDEAPPSGIPALDLKGKEILTEGLWQDKLHMVPWAKQPESHCHSTVYLQEGPTNLQDSSVGSPHRRVLPGWPLCMSAARMGYTQNSEHAQPPGGGSCCCMGSNPPSDTDCSALALLDLQECSTISRS
jgi:hypothetical protein